MKLTSILLIGLLVVGALARGPGDACYDACEKREREAGQTIDAVIYHTCIWECDEKETKINFKKIIDIGKKVAPLILKEENENKISFKKIVNIGKKIAPLVLLNEKKESKINFKKIVDIGKKVAPLILKSEDPLDQIKIHVIISKLAEQNALQQTADNTDVIKGSQIANISKVFYDMVMNMIPKIKEEFKTIPATKEEIMSKASMMLITELPNILKELKGKFSAEEVTKYGKYILPILLN